LNNEELRRLDALVAEKVMGWKLSSFNSYYLNINDQIAIQAKPWEYHPSSDLNACFEAQAKCIEKVGIDYFDYLQSELWEEAGGQVSSLNAIVAGPAIRCRAMIAAVEAKEKP